MNMIFRKIKHVTASWVIASIVGGAFVTAGINPAPAALIATLMVLLLYIASSKRLVEKKIPDSVASEAKEFVREIDEIRARAGQIYRIQQNQNSPEIDAKLFESLYKDALLMAVKNAKEDHSPAFYFGAYLNDVLQSRKSRIQSPSIDQVVFELSSRKYRTKFQDEYISYISYTISKRNEPLEELSLLYFLDQGRIDVKPHLKNFVGEKIISFTKLIDINSKIIGINDIFKIDARDL